MKARVIVLAGPSGAGKSRLAERIGLPVLRLDDFYKCAGDPTLPLIAEGANAGMVDWDDPADPIRRLVIPDGRELRDWGRLDASNEAAYTVARGVQHKYPSTVLLLVNEVCGAYCRYCFRKRLFMEGNDETSLDVSEGLEYIRRTPTVTNVLLTGGDPLVFRR